MTLPCILSLSSSCGVSNLGEVLGISEALKAIACICQTVASPRASTHTPNTRSLPCLGCSSCPASGFVLGLQNLGAPKSMWKVYNSGVAETLDAR
jgi:hypothetical protein